MLVLVSTIALTGGVYGRSRCKGVARSSLAQERFAFRKSEGRETKSTPSSCANLIGFGSSSLFKNSSLVPVIPAKAGMERLDVGAE